MIWQYNITLRRFLSTSDISMSGCGIIMSSYDIIWQCMVRGLHLNVNICNFNVKISHATVYDIIKSIMWKYNVRLYGLSTSRCGNNIAGDCTI